jgi:hypothetical protein
MWPVKGSCNLTGVGRERAGELKHPGAPIFSQLQHLPALLSLSVNLPEIIESRKA